MNAKRFRLGTVLCASVLSCAMSLASAQQSSQLRGVAPPPVVVPQVGNSSRVQGVKSSIDDSARVGRDIDAATRRVQADVVDNEIQRRERDLRDDRVRADQQRAASNDPYRAAAIDRGYQAREADTRRRVKTLEQQRDQLQQPVPTTVPAAPPASPPPPIQD